MGKKKNQLSLPGIKGEEVSRFPQPHVRKFRDIKRYEIAYRPFDLKFRGQINKWLQHQKLARGVAIEKILDEFQLKIVNLYFFPEVKDKKWLNQEEVAGKFKGLKKRKLRKILVNALFGVWKRLKVEELGAS